jgi:hypothetical protein
MFQLLLVDGEQAGQKGKNQTNRPSNRSYKIPLSVCSTTTKSIHRSGNKDGA